MSDKQKPAYWTGTVSKCDLCGKPIAKAFVDGKVINGMWAIMDEGCYGRIGRGIGPGLGQRYELQDDGRWLKTEG